MGPDGTSGGASLKDYLQTLRRRKWIVLQALVLVPVVAVLLEMRQPAAYQATSQVLINNRDLTALTGYGLTGYQDPSRVAQTHADLARVPAVAEIAVERADANLSPQAFLGMSSATPQIDADLIYLSVTDTARARAIDLASAYAFALTNYRAELDSAAYEEALRDVDAQLQELESEGRDNSALYSNLVQKQQQLEELRVLQSNSLSVVNPAVSAFQVAPSPFKSAVLGLLIGLVLGLALAFLRDTLDTRVRTAEEVSERLGATMLARLSAPAKRIASANRLVMLDDPTGVAAEAFRVLRANLEFVTVDRQTRSIMITSALEGEGKSTTAANLAVAFARAGKRVVLVDLDLRRPYIDRFFDLRGRPGLTQVALGHASLDAALVRIALTDGSGRSANADAQKPNGNGGGRFAGLLEVLPSGPVPPDAGEFVGTRAVAAILEELGNRADLVIVDAPPALQVGDAMTLSSRVDGILVVARLKALRRAPLKELRRTLSNSPVPVLGFVATGAETDKSYGYGYGYAPAPTSIPRRRGRRERVAR